MLKKIVALILMAVAPVAAVEILGELGPATSTSAVSIAAPGADKQNCLSSVHVGISAYGSNTATIRIIDGLSSGTTVYSLVVSTSSGLSAPNPIAIYVDPDDPLCASSNNGIRIYTTATTSEINYQGYVRRTR